MKLTYDQKIHPFNPTKGAFMAPCEQGLWIYSVTFKRNPHCFTVFYHGAGYLSDDFLHAVSSAEEYGALIHAVQVLRDLDAVVREGKLLKPSENFDHYWSFCHQVLYDRDLRFDINAEGTWMLER